MNDNQGRTGAGEFGSNDERLIDLLVDGELVGAERRRLLEQLDRWPDGWRRCAFAFLEAQAWQGAFGSICNDVAAVPASAAATDVACVPPEKGRQGWTPARWSVPALAATFLLAFSIGWFGHDWKDLSQGSAQTNQQPRQNQLADRSSVAPDEPNEFGEPAGELRTDSDSAPDVRFVGLLTWTVKQDGTERAVAVPIVEGDQIDEEWLMSQPVTVPESVLRAVERHGHKLIANRQLVPIELEGGRRAVMPVDQIEIRLAGRVYQ